MRMCAEDAVVIRQDEGDRVPAVAAPRGERAVDEAFAVAQVWKFLSDLGGRAKVEGFDVDAVVPDPADDAFAFARDDRVDLVHGQIAGQAALHAIVEIKADDNSGA